MSKGKGGPINLPSCKGDRGMPKGSLPKVSEGKSGPITLSGAGGNKGIPKKAPGGGKGSQWAGTHD